MEDKKEQETGVATTETKAPVVKIPKFTDLIKEDREEEVFQRDSLNWLLNQPPPEKWLKINKYATGPKVINAEGQEIQMPYRYLPIEKVELLLTRIFQVWSVEILREGTMFNSVYCAVRVYYRDPITGEMMHQDGIGATDVQTKAGKPASDLSAIVAGAIQKGLPAAKTYAVKDACDQIGKLFGKDLNRADAIAFTMGYNTGEKTMAETLDDKVDTHAIPAEVVIAMQKAESKKSANEVYADHPELHDIAEFKDLVKQRHAEIDLLILQKKAEEAKNGNQS